MDPPKQADFQTKPENRDVPESIDQSLDETQGLLLQTQGLGFDISEAAREVRQAYWNLGNQDLLKRQWPRQIAIVVATLFSMFYLVFRVLYTLNLQSTPSMIFSVTLLAAECYGLFHLALYFYQVWRLVELPIQPVPVGCTVDIFVTTYNEEVDLLHNTLRACTEMEYPHTTYVLDDGNRQEVRKLAENLGVEYITRTDRKDAKAGNVNHALRQTNGEFVVLLDADHVPHKHFITRLLGYFREPKVGFVQAPHTTYNLDNFLGSWDANSQMYWEDVRIFYEAVQLGKNRHGVACYCGSATMFRREAVEDIGLFATETITEDLHTGMRINAAGWKSYAVSEDLVVGLAPEDPETFSSQRLRWGEGNLSVLAYDNPLTMKGLRFSGRINYLASILNWTYGPARLIMYLVPIVMLLTGVSPVAHFSAIYGIVVIAYLISVWAAVKVASNGCGNLLGIELAMMASFHLQLRALWRAIFRRRFQRFVVTPKKRKEKTAIFRLMMPQAIIVGLGIIAVSWATARVAFGLSVDYLGLAVGSGLAFYHAWLGFTIIRNASRERAPDTQWRHPVQLVVNFTSNVTVGRAVTLNLNENGLTMLSRDRLEEKDWLDIRIESPHSNVHCLGHVIATKKVYAGKQSMYAHEVNFGSLSPAVVWDEKDTLERLLFGYVVPWIVLEHRRKRTLIDLKTRSSKGGENIPLPLKIKVKDAAIPDQDAVIEQINRNGLVTTLAYPLNEGSTAEIEIHGPIEEITLTAQVTNIQTIRIGANIVHRHRFDWVKPIPNALPDTVRLMKKLYRHNSGFSSPEKRNHPWYANMPSWATGIAATVLVAVGLFWVTHQNDLLMVAAAKRPLTPAEQNELKSVTKAGADARFISTDRLLRMYHATVDAKQYRVAAKIATRLSKKFPEQSCQWITAAASHWAQIGRYKKADHLFKDVITSGRERRRPVDEQATIYLEAARVAIAVGDIDRSAGLFTKAGNLRSFDQKEIDEYIGLLIAAKKLPQAFRLLKQMDKNDRVLRRIVEVYEIAKKPELAVGALEALHAENPEDTTVTLRLAELTYERGNFDKSIKYYRELLQRLPSDTKVRRQFAGVLVTLKRPNEAIDLLRQNNDPKSLLLLVSILESNGQFEAAMAQLRQVTGKTIHTLDYQKQFIRLLMATKQYDEAVQHLIVYLEQYPSDWNLQKDFIAAVAVSTIDNSEKNLLATKETSQEVLRLENKKASIRKIVSHIYDRYKAADFQPLDLNSFDQLGTALQRLDKPSDAITVLRLGVKKYPKSRALRLRLAQALSAAGEYDAAEKQFAKLLNEKR